MTIKGVKWSVSMSHHSTMKVLQSILYSINYLDFDRLFMLYLKLALVLVYAFGRSNLADQAIAFWGILTIWMMWTCIRLPYRCQSSNRQEHLKYLRSFLYWKGKLK